MESHSDPLGGPTLADADGARAAVVARVVAPWWYLPLVGLLAAQHVLVQGGENLNRTLPSGLLLVVGSAVAWLLWRNAMGITVWPAAGWRSLLALGTWSLGIGLCIWAAAFSRAEPVVVIAALVALLATLVLGQVWQTALRGDLARADGWTP